MPNVNWFVVTLRIHPDTLLGILWGLLEDRKMWKIESWKVPANVDLTWVADRRPPFLKPEEAEERKLSDLDFIHEAYVAPLVSGGYIDVRILSGELRDGIVRLNRQSLERGVTLMSQHYPLKTPEEPCWVDSPYLHVHEEFMQYCLFGELLFSETR